MGMKFCGFPKQDIFSDTLGIDKKKLISWHHFITHCYCSNWWHNFQHYIELV